LWRLLARWRCILALGGWRRRSLRRGRVLLLSPEILLPLHLLLLSLEVLSLLFLTLLFLTLLFLLLLLGLLPHLSRRYDRRDILLLAS
jgi:hypothetical protein